jgi:hypothetical protein
MVACRKERFTWAKSERLKAIGKKKMNLHNSGLYVGCLGVHASGNFQRVVCIFLNYWERDLVKNSSIFVNNVTEIYSISTKRVRR